MTGAGGTPQRRIAATTQSPPMGSQAVHIEVDIIGELRSLAPARALSWTEVHSVAERQATKLLALFHVDEGPVPQFVITSLPGLVVDWRADWPTSGMAVDVGQRWRIVIRSSECRQRQRFTLAHEFKHVLDDPLIDRVFAHLPVHRRGERAERVCNYFAACLLMPREWIKRDWGEGIQDIRALARRYYVSSEAMAIRLRELGLIRSSVLALAPRRIENPREGRPS